RLADNGLTTREFSETIDAFNDGLRVAEVSVGGDRIDLVLSGPEDQAAATQTIGQLPVITASGLIVPASSLADIVMTAGPIQIRHRERQRTITLQIRPAPALALQTAIERVQRHVIERLQAEGLPPGTRVTLAGTADRLSQTWAAMVWQVLLAIVVVYLILAILMESMTLPAIIIVSVPLATAGGVAGLAVVNLFVRQPLDMLTMLGFVILVGTVVNNAILIAYQTMHHIRDDKLPTAAAISEATSNRIRPIFMSTLTNVVGMLPLVLFPGAGSELYRGIGSVVIGGLSLSAVLTLALIPALLSLVLPRARTGAAAPAAVVVPERHAAE
ncbi:MAG: efflux RND transporter permease subunit, partial [Defluviicoccus sp.]|nr:efflux RND transporter permease subunit [Defluviicoccus sp.]